MKLMFYINSLSGGGAERVIANLSSQFAQHGHSVCVVTSFPTEKEYPVSDGVVRINLEEKEQACSFLKRNLGRIRKLRRVIKQQKPDLVVSFMAEPNFRTVFATRFLKTHVVLSVRNDPNREYGNRLFRFLAKTTFRWADGIVFQTEDAQSWFPKRIQKRSAVIANQVNPKFFEQPVPEKRSGICSVGRLSAQKNFACLIRAYAAIADRVEDDLTIYGEGDLRPALEKQIAEAGLQERVHLPGNVTDIEKRICGAKLFVMSSDFEGMPNALMEAMALGLPCISTDCPCGGPKMLLNDADNGVLVPIADSEAMAKAIAELACDAERCAQMGVRARKRAEDFLPDRIYARWEDYLTEVARVR